MEAFSILDVFKNILNSDGWQCELESVFTADSEKQPSIIQEVAEIIRQLELNQALIEVTKLLRLILIIPAIFAPVRDLLRHWSV